MYLFRLTCSPGQEERNVQAENAIRPFYYSEGIRSALQEWVPTEENTFLVRSVGSDNLCRSHGFVHCILHHIVSHLGL